MHLDPQGLEVARQMLGNLLAAEAEGQRAKRATIRGGSWRMDSGRVTGKD
jgi:hypothetical protein